MKRVDANLIPFAKNNPSGYRFAFGTDTATDDINVNYNDNIKKGWGTTPNEFPEVEDFNAMAYTSSYLTAYLYQMGIAEWNNKQNYRANSRVIASDGNLYKSLTGTSETPNTGNNPLSDVVNWGIDNQFYINSLASKATPIDTDNFGIQETGGLFKKLSWANIKTVLGSLYVGLTGNQTIAGVKTFSSNIVGNITGNAGTATNASNLGGNAPSYYQQALGFTPIQQGGGASQKSSKIYIGWQGPYLRCQVDGTDFGTTFPMNIIGNAGTATIAADSNKLIGKNWYWSGQGGQPMWVWGGSDGDNMYVYNPANFNVNTAVSLSTAVGSAPSYACRAWVNFNGTGTVAIRASGNVSSITDNGTGDYTVNFTTAMPDANYSLAGIASASGTGGTFSSLVLTEGLAASNTYALKTKSAITVYTLDNNSDSAFDAFSANVSIFR